MLPKVKDLFYKFFKFGLVGFSGLIVDFAITYILKEQINIDKYVANGVGFLVAASSNFFLNKLWTFEDRSDKVKQQYLAFIGIALVGLGINQLVLYSFHHYFSLNFYMAKLIAIMVVTLWNFSLNHFFTFNRE